MGRPAKQNSGFDRELTDLPPEMRWREWMGRVEAVIFAASVPVSREILTSLVGRACNIDVLIEDIRDELRARPYELVAVAGGFQHRTRRAFADVIRASGTSATPSLDLSRTEALVVTAIAYFQPVTRAGLADILGREISRDTIAALRRAELIATGPRSPQPGAPFTYVTTPALLSFWGLQSIRDLPDMDKLEEAGLLSKVPLQEELRSLLGLEDGMDDEEGIDVYAERLDAT